MKKLFNNYKQRQLQACEVQKGKVLIKSEIKNIRRIWRKNETSQLRISIYKVVKSPRKVKQCGYRYLHSKDDKILGDQKMQSHVVNNTLETYQTYNK